MIKKILDYNLFSILFLCCFMVDVSAASYTGFDYTAKLYDNVNGNLTSVTTSGPYNEGLYEGYISYTANSSGGAWLISSPITLITNHTYTLTASIPNECGPLVLSSVNRIGVGSNSNYAKASYTNNKDVNEVYSRIIGGDYFLIQYAFTPTINGSYIVFPFATSVSCGSSKTILANIVIDDLGLNSATEEQINTSLNNQTNTINNSIQNSTNTIINNQNQNNEELKDTINENFNSCHDSYNLFDKSNLRVGYVQSSTGEFLQGGESSATRNIINLPDNTYTVSGAKTVKICYYDENSVFVKCDILEGSDVYTFTLNEYNNIRLQFMTSSIKNIMLNVGNTAKPYEPYGEEICSNKIDETNNQLGDLNNNITNDNIDNNNLSNSFNEFENFIDENATISSLITLPVTLFTAILNGIQNTCTPFNLGSLYGENLVLPCINLSSYLGNTLWTMIDIIISGFAIYYISKKFIKVFNNFSSMKEGDVIDD